MAEPNVSVEVEEVNEEVQPVTLMRRERVFSLAPQTIAEAIDFAKLVASSELCPKEYRGKPEAVLVAVQMGSELGIPPMQALQNIAVINGKPCMYGDLVLGLVKASGLLEYIDERDPEEALKKAEGWCEVKRKGEPKPVARTFSMEAADRAGLIKRSKGNYGDGPWITYPGRMLLFRARSWALRDVFPDVLKGLQVREEVEDYPAGPEPVAMPKRESDTKKLTTFVDEAAARKPEPKKKPEEAEQKEWRGVIVDIQKREGKTRGRTWTLWTVHCEDKMQFGTFSKDTYEAAASAMGAATPVRIVWEKTPKGSKKIVIMEPVGVEEEGREAGAEG